MIKVDRHKIAKPSFFSSKEYEHLQHEIQKFYELHKNSRAQRSFDNSYRNFPSEVVNTLMKLFSDKCAYCESYLRKTKAGDGTYLRHFRPTNNAQGFDSKEVAEDHYWWLSYEWENLYTTCHSCQRHKSNKFPVDGKRATVSTPIN